MATATETPTTEATTEPPVAKPSLRRSRINPVLGRELRGRMRGWRAPVIITVWLLATLGVSWLVYTATGVAVDDPFANPLGNADLGRGIFDWVLFVMMLVMLFLIPGQAAGAIAGERDRQTLVPLQVSLLSPRQLLFGKIAASSAFLVLLMVAAMPVLAVAYVIGGVRISEILVGVGAVVATGVLLATIATSVSALAKRVQGAVVLSYLLALALTIGPVIAYGVAALVDSSRGTDETDPPEWLLIPNPFIGVADIAGDRFTGSVPSPWDGIWEVIHADDRDRFVEVQGGVFVEEGFDVEGNRVFVEEGFAVDVAPTTVVVLGDDEVVVDEVVVDGEVVVDDETVETRPPPPPPIAPGVAIDQVIVGPGGGQQVDVFGQPVPAPRDQPGDGVPYWVRSLGAQAGLALILLLAAIRRLRTPALVER